MATRYPRGIHWFLQAEHTRFTEALPMVVVVVAGVGCSGPRCVVGEFAQDVSTRCGSPAPIGGPRQRPVPKEPASSPKLRCPIAEHP